MHCASASVGEACDSIERRCTTGLQRWTLNRTLNSLPALQSCTEIAAVSAKRVKVRPALELKPAKNRRLPRKLLTRSPALLRNLPRSWQNSEMLPRFSMVALCVEAKRVHFTKRNVQSQAFGQCVDLALLPKWSPSWPHIRAPAVDAETASTSLLRRYCCVSSSQRRRLLLRCTAS